MGADDVAVYLLQTQSQSHTLPAQGLMSCMHSEEEHLLNKYPTLINCAGKRKSLNSSRQLLLIQGDYFIISKASFTT